MALELTNSVLNHILSIGKGEKYLILCNTVGQQWLFPFENPKLGLSLFQPSSFIGKLVLKTLPFLKRLPWILKRMNISTQKIEFTNSFLDKIKEYFDVTSVQLSIFCGSPGKHMKPTILIVSQDNYLGYCKLSDNPDVIEIFKKEQLSLDYLAQKGVQNIPTIKCCLPMTDNSRIWLFVQTTQRNKHATIAKHDSKELYVFIEEMRRCSKIKIDFHESDYFKCLRRLKGLLSIIQDTPYYDIVDKSIRIVESYLNKTEVAYSAYHGDLTPWNSFIVDGHLYAFDFEYFQKTYPPYADFYHFFTQEYIYNKYACGEKIYSEFLRLKTNKYITWENSDLWYVCYLLCIMEFYLSRDKGFLNDRIVQCFNIWGALIYKLIGNA